MVSQTELSPTTPEEIFAKLPSLATDRLRIRQMQTTDAPALFAIKSDLEVTKHYGQEPHRSLDQTREWVQKRIADYERREVIFWVLVLKDDNTAIGSVCFWNFDPAYRCAEIGYELHPTYWRKGIMSEALSAIITFGFKELALHRIEANPLAINQPSSDLLLKLGFKDEGTLRERIFFRGRFIDQMYFGLKKNGEIQRVDEPSRRQRELLAASYLRRTQSSLYSRKLRL